MTISVYIPTARRPIKAAQLAERHSTIRGVRLGLLDNSKVPAGQLIVEASRQLKAMGALDGIQHLKPSAGNPIQRGPLMSLANSSGAILNALAD